ncbi:MAG: class I SAM-dependent methyltransferase [Acidobacteriota bacterium]|nr:class I SAM-dependent methyltransferase [Acidobacteriota bacterium]MDE3044024.1 class I SAM-dependent methyltransferase [Acidobacteriota bacterium]MDE3107634.1 class I SAM-dependent methyltransferase [Acidobacteriota bacterium]MDE3221937.1 class I SAM-dependent methyltransferase [Acidobacteriota bacterium]
MSRLDELLNFADTVKGFMPRLEGLALHDHARDVARARPGGTWLEIGSWCGKSAVYLGAAAETSNCLLYSLDHHHGSEENQRGWAYFDESLVDAHDGRLNTLPFFQRTIAVAQLERTVVALVGHSELVAAHFAQPLDLLFIDGGHARDVAWRDYERWTPKVTMGGTLLIHDVFEDPRDGGRPPYEIYLDARDSGRFVDVASEGSLRVLRRVA